MISNLLRSGRRCGQKVAPRNPNARKASATGVSRAAPAAATIARNVPRAGQEVQLLSPFPAPAASAATNHAEHFAGANPSHASAIAVAFAAAAAAAAAVAALAQAAACQDAADEDDEEGEEGEDEALVMTNWSGTHSCTPSRVYHPETSAEVAALLKEHHAKGAKLRVVGSGLSPNGIGLGDSGAAMLNLAHLDKVLQIDRDKAEVSVQAGMKVGDLCAWLEPHGLTLENLASIAEQQVGGFTQVGAHGTGARVPPVDMQVISMRLATPGLGLIELSDSKNKELFALAKVGLGVLGVVTEVTLRCVPKHDLIEHTYVATRNHVKEHHSRLLREHRHVRFMWVPFADCVVVVTNDPVPEALKKPGGGGYDLSSLAATHPAVSDPPLPLRELLRSETDARRRRASQGAPQGLEIAGGAELPTEAEIAQLGFAQLRDALLALDPLSSAWVRRVNTAEAQSWERAQGFRVGRNVDLLQFDCGGQQWVSEVAFPAGTLDHPTGADLRFMDKVLEIIERGEGLPAPSPIEQRWTANSTSKMSPACATERQRSELQAGAKLDETFHSWVGIIMYLPTEDPNTRKRITDAFGDYRRLCETEAWPMVGAAEHWAKIEVPGASGAPNEGEPAHVSAKELKKARDRLAARYPLEAFARARRTLDPKGVLGNAHVGTLLAPSPE